MLSPLKAELVGEKEGRCVWRLIDPLIYYGKITVVVPIGFETDFASVPRVPLAYWLCGGEANVAAVVHDYLYCIDAVPNVSKETADNTFLEVMKETKETVWKRNIMYKMVKWFASGSFKKRHVMDSR